MVDRQKESAHNLSEVPREFGLLKVDSKASSDGMAKPAFKSKKLFHYLTILKK